MRLPESGYNLGAFPLDDNLVALRHYFWLATDSAYKSALEVIARKRAALQNVTVTDQGPDFSKAGATSLVLATPRQAVDEEPWKSRLRGLSALFASHPRIIGSSVEFYGYPGRVLPCELGRNPSESPGAGCAPPRQGLRPGAGRDAAIRFGELPLPGNCEPRSGGGSTPWRGERGRERGIADTGAVGRTVHRARDVRTSGGRPVAGGSFGQESRTEAPARRRTRAYNLRFRRANSTDGWVPGSFPNGWT